MLNTSTNKIKPLKERNLIKYRLKSKVVIFEYLGTAQAVPLTVWTNCPSVVLMLRRLNEKKIRFNSQVQRLFSYLQEKV